MAQRSRPADSGDNDNAIYERGTKRKVPRWATVLIIVLAVIGLMFIVMVLVGGAGGHGPGRHMGAGPTGDPATTSAGIGRSL